MPRGRARHLRHCCGDYVGGSSDGAGRSSDRGQARGSALDWTDCGEGFECAHAKVPLDYDEPHGETIALSLKRLPASDPSRRIGSLFLNPGGPGGSGVEFVKDDAQYLFSKEVRARFDLVGFDPRGIRRSTPLRCFGSLDEVGAALAPFPFPYTRAEERVFEHSDKVIANACAKNAGPILDHMSTANVARDLDLLRQAVGDSKLTYYGISYGTYIGETYANLFPKTFARWSSTGSSTRSGGRQAGVTKRAPFRHSHACTTTRASTRRSSSSSRSAIRVARTARSPAAPQPGSGTSLAVCSTTRSR